MKRRSFLIATAAAAGGLALGYRLLDATHGASAQPEGLAPRGEVLLSGWVKIGRDDTVTVYVPHVDMGQGSHTALAMMLAEEMDADWSRVRTEQAPADDAFANRFLARGFVMSNRQVPALFDGVVDSALGIAARYMKLQITGGSSAVRFTGQDGMRVAGAVARELLMQAAARRWNVPMQELHTANGAVHHAASSRSTRYGALAEAAAQLPVPSKPKLKNAADFKLIGTSPPRLDIPGKVNGNLKYGIDISLPNMRYAAVTAAPVHGEKLVACDVGAALAMAGVERVVQLPDAVAVIAHGYWAARNGLLALKPVFGDGGNRAVSSAGIERAHGAALLNDGMSDEASDGEKVLREQGDAPAQLTQDGVRAVDATYHVPFLHHAAMEPINFTAQFAAGNIYFWGGAQNLLWTRAELAKLAGVPMDKVNLFPMPLGGSFGRRSLPNMTNYLPQIVQIGREASPYPVKMIWSREEDFVQGAYRPALASRIRAALADDGLPTAWVQSYIDTGGRNEAYLLPYAIPHQSIRAMPSTYHIRFGAWRSVAHTQHGFYTESFIDELAHATGRDPYLYRRNLLPPGSRHRRVLETAAQQAGWDKPLAAGHARGIAIVASFGSIVAEVVEVSLDADRTPRIHRVTAAVDCGGLVHPDTARQQVEGSIVMGLSAALAEQITIRDGAVMQRNFPDYPLLRMHQVPEIDIHFLTSDAPLGGLGEPAVPPVAPALTNALFALTGKRIRALPVARTAL